MRIIMRLLCLPAMAVAFSTTAQTVQTTDLGLLSTMYEAGAKLVTKVKDNKEAVAIGVGSGDAALLAGGIAVSKVLETDSKNAAIKILQEGEAGSAADLAKDLTVVGKRDGKSLIRMLRNVQDAIAENKAYTGRDLPNDLPDDVKEALLMRDGGLVKSNGEDFSEEEIEELNEFEEFYENGVLKPKYEKYGYAKDREVHGVNDKGAEGGNAEGGEAVGGDAADAADTAANAAGDETSNVVEGLSGILTW